MSRAVSRRDVLIGATASAVALAGPMPAWSGIKRVHEVSIKGFAFEPKAIMANVGDVIRWTNKDLAPHTATAAEFGWDSGKIAKDESVEVEVTPDMELDYFCAFHPRMTGTIVIAG